MVGADGRLDQWVLGTGSRSAPAPHRLILPFRVTSLLAAQMFDFATFMLMIQRHGIAAEANPLVAAGFGAFGMPILALMKIALTVLLASIVVILSRGQTERRSGQWLAALISVFAVAGGLLGGVSNVLAT